MLRSHTQAVSVEVVGRPRLRCRDCDLTARLPAGPEGPITARYLLVVSKVASGLLYGASLSIDVVLIHAAVQVAMWY